MAMPSPVGRINVESGSLRLNTSVLSISLFSTMILRACSLVVIVGSDEATISVKNQWYVVVRGGGPSKTSISLNFRSPRRWEIKFVGQVFSIPTVPIDGFSGILR